MGLRIQNNITAMNAHRNLTVSDNALSKSLERLSSGYRVNRAADDAAGLAISQGMRADIASYKVASRNAAEANALAQVAEGAYDQIGGMLKRLKELATQASSSNAASNLDKINAEGNALISEIDRITTVTEYAGTALLNGTFGVTVSAAGSLSAAGGFSGAEGLLSGQTYTLAVVANGTDWDISVTATIGGNQMTQEIEAVTAPVAGETADLRFAALGLTMTMNENFDVGANAGVILANAGTAATFQIGAKNTDDNRIGINLSGVTTTDLSISADSMLNATDAQTFLDTIDAAIDTLNDARGDVGAIMNRIGYASANLATTIENYQAAESVIRDVDMAAEMATFTKNQILLQAGTAMLAQANLAPQSILSLLG